MRTKFVFLLFLLSSLIYVHLLLLPKKQFFYDSLKKSRNAVTLTRIFPRKKCKCYNVLKVFLEQTSFPNNAFVQTYCYKKKMYHLWLVFPFSVTSSKIIYKSPNKFTWTLSNNLQYIFIGDVRNVLIFEKDSYNIWSLRQTIYLLSDNNTSEIYVTCVTSSFTLCKTNTSFYAVLKSGDDFLSKLITLDYCVQDMNIHARSIDEKNGLLILSSPKFKKFDGIILVYKICENLLESTKHLFKHEQTISPPLPATYFGSHYGIGYDGMLIVSAPFAPSPLYGVGVVYIYKLIDSEYNIYQTLLCPESRSASEQSVLEFGYKFTLSDDGVWLAIFCKYKNGRVYVYKYETRRKQYVVHNTIKYDIPDYKSIHENISIDLNGNVLISTENSVFLVM